jgi:microcystin-dependent protein
LSERVRITNSGNVGIGTNSPSEKLTVFGNISASGSITTNEIYSRHLELAQDRGSGDGAHIDFKTLPNEDYDCRIIQEDNGLQVSTGGNGASFVRMTILSGGNVGINTGTPNERLTVAGNLSARGLLYIGGSGGGRVYHNDEANTTRWESGILGFAGERDWSLYDAQAAQSRVTVLTSGNVGIGTRTPNENLTVVGNISASGIIYSQGQIAGASPTGSVMYYCLPSAPTGWIECNGAAITVAMGSAYTALRALLINASNPFGVVGSDPKIPDLRGKFIRSNGSDGTYTSGTFGQTQADAFGSHRHAFTDYYENETRAFNYRRDSNGGAVENTAAAAAAGITDFQGDTETRPVNIALLACIKL